MWPALQDQRGELGRARANRRRLTADPLDRPFGVTPVRTRRVLGYCRMPTATGAAQMHRDALALAEQLDRVRGDARIELLADQPVRHRVVMPVDVDVIIETNPARPPFGVLVRFGRQLLQCRAVELEEQVAAADASGGCGAWAGVAVG